MKSTTTWLILLSMVFLAEAAVAAPKSAPARVNVPISEVAGTPEIESSTVIANTQAEQAALEKKLNQRWANQAIQAKKNAALLKAINAARPPAP